MAEATALLRQPEFRRFWLSRLAGTAASQMLLVALGWQMYELTGSAWDLGLVGLAQVLPALLLALPAGHQVDHSDRRTVLATALAVQVAVAVALVLALASASGQRLAAGWGVARCWRCRWCWQLAYAGGAASGDPPGPGAAGHAGRDARPCQRGEFGLHRRIEPVGRIRIRRHGGLVGACSIGGLGRCGHWAGGAGLDRAVPRAGPPRPAGVRSGRQSSTGLSQVVRGVDIQALAAVLGGFGISRGWVGATAATALN